MGGGISIVSDIHIKQCRDQAYSLLMSFFRHPLVQSSAAIYLLGDVFDCMLGRHREYQESYQDYFRQIGELLKEGKQVHYFQGNHDIHVEMNYRDYFNRHQILDDQFFYHTRPLIRTIWGKTFFFAHGDEIEIGNWGHKIYKAATISSVMRFLADNIISYGVISRFIEPLSEISRKSGQHYGSELIRKKFRETAIKQAAKGYDYIVLGHSHIKDDYIHNKGQSTQFVYLNNGYFLSSKTFIHLSDGQHSFINLSD